MAKISGLVAVIKIKRWAKPLLLACALLRLPPPKFLFSVTVEPA